MRFNRSAPYFQPRIWSVLMTIILLVLAAKATQGLNIETNVLALLPDTEQDQVLQQASQKYEQSLARRYIFLVEGNDLKSAIAAADQLSEGLQSLAHFSEINYHFDQDYQRRSIAPYLKHRTQLLDESSRNLLKQGGGQALLQSNMAMIYSPMAATSSSLLSSDPLLLMYRFVTGLSKNAGSVSLQDSRLVSQHNGKFYVLINTLLNDSPFSIQLQQQLLPAIEQQVNKLKQQYSTIDVLHIGVLRYAAAGVSSARQEISTIGLGSLAGVILILLLVFRSSKPLLLSVLPILSGCIAAFTACQLLFNSVHLLTLVFGASLIGISIDYSFHFFTDRLAGDRDWRGSNALQRIFPGISLGLITSLLGYLGLCFAPFPGMQQMALFSTVGLLVAFLTVACLFPRLMSEPLNQSTPSPFLTISKQWLKLSQCPNTVIIVLLLACLIFSITGLQRLSTNDDIRLLQTAPAALKAQEKKILAITNATPSQQYLLLEAESIEQLLQREEQLLPILTQLQDKQDLKTFDSISQRLPSIAKQRNNHRLITDTLIADQPLLSAYEQDLGFSTTVIDSFKHQYQVDSEDFLTLDEWLNTAASDQLRHLWLGQTARGYASIITLYGGNSSAIKKSLEQQQHVTLVEKVSEISNLLGKYRQRAVLLVAFSYLVIYILLSIRYRPLRAFQLMMAPAIAVLMALGTLGWAEAPLNLFHLLALLLILGIGIDYTLFLEEGRDHRNSTMLAILLSAITTLLSFGLLALSETPAVQAFGVIVLIGISVCVILAPMLTSNTTMSNKV